jgi:excisionase family DNA binding protein
MTTTSVSSPAEFYSVPSAAKAIGLSNMVLYRAIWRGEFPALKVEGRYLIPTATVKDMSDAAVTSGGVVNSADWVTGRSAVEYVGGRK